MIEALTARVAEWREHHDRRWLEQYVRNVLYVLDLAGNVILLFGDPKETISSRMAKRAEAYRRESWQWPWWKRVLGYRSVLGCCVLNWIDDGHCERSKHPELGGNQVWRNPWKSVGAGLVVVALFVVGIAWAC